MFSVIFPGQGSQSVGMAKELYNKFDTFKINFEKADNILNYQLSKIILEGPDDKLNLTENTQPAIFLTSYAIFKVAQKEFGVNFEKAQFIAGHSLGEYSALCCSKSLNFDPVDFLYSCSDWIGAYHLSDNDGTQDSNDMVRHDSWFWPHIRRDLGYYCLEVYGIPPRELVFQRDLVISKLKEKINDI